MAASRCAAVLQAGTRCAEAAGATAARSRAERVVLAVRQARPWVALAVRQAPAKRLAFFAVRPAQR